MMHNTTWLCAAPQFTLAQSLHRTRLHFSAPVSILGVTSLSQSILESRAFFRIRSLKNCAWANEL
jgi:hypothetical protein